MKYKTKILITRKCNWEITLKMRNFASARIWTLTFFNKNFMAPFTNKVQLFQDFEDPASKKNSNH